jgi:hydroxymethylbilane synthase
MQITFATRPSKLARWQTQWVIEALKVHHPELDCQVHIITTKGDKIIDTPLPKIGGKGLFTAELESELLSGRIQAAVHSLKDLPVENPPGLKIGAIPLRGAASDVLVSSKGFRLENLPAGARLGTSSLRRAAQVLALRPDLNIVPLRGNVDTRVSKVLDGQYEAIILAAAGLERLGLGAHISQRLPVDQILPAPGQGALAVQCRADDEETLALLAAIDDANTRVAVSAERQFLFHLGGGCSVPVGAYAGVSDQSVVKLSGRVISLDGKEVVNVSGVGPDPLALGQRLAQEAVSKGAAEILKEAKPDK